MSEEIEYQPNQAGALEDPSEQSASADANMIMQARQQLLETRQRAREAAINGVGSANLMYTEAAKNYALSVASLLQSDQYGDPELWQDADVLKATVTWQEALLQQRNDDKILDITPDSEPDVVDPEEASVRIEGVSEFLRTDFPREASFAWLWKTPTGPIEKSETVNIVPKFSDIDGLVFLIDNWRRKNNLGVRHPDETGVNDVENRDGF